jgi:Uma2 family endonuclease
MATFTQQVPSQRLILNDVDWKMYSRLLRLFGGQRSLRLSYDRGVLEIMSPLPEHESDARFLGCLVMALADELGMTFKVRGSSTFRTRRSRRGLEPDDSYWIAHEPQVRGKRQIDLRVDPPPDLAIESDVTRSSVNRMGIYAAIGVPEVWRIENQSLTFHLLGANRRYAEAANSLSFPTITPADLIQFMAMRGPQLAENEIIRQFRVWVRQRAVTPP